MSGLLPDKIPASVPRRAGRWPQKVGRFLLRIAGWRVTGELPDTPKLVLALAPHTSNWDFVIGKAAIMASGVKVSYLMKKEAFIWPFSLFFVWFGGVPLNRKASGNTVEQLVGQFAERDQLWVAIAPEGTRKKVDCWKTGFLRIAHAAEIPVQLLVWDYKAKALRLDKLWQPTGNHEQDAKDIRAYVNSRFAGKYPHLQ